MINGDHLESLLALPANDPAVIQALKDMRADLPASAGDLSQIEANKVGIGLTFQVYRGALALAEITFFGEPGFAGGPPFTGQLPRGIAFTDTREALLARFGEPTWRAARGAIDRWERDGKFVTCTHIGKESLRLWNVAVGLVR